MLTRVLAKNTPLLLRRSFPLNEAGSKTGTGTLSVTATATTAPQGTLNPAVQNRVPAILRPIMPRGPQLLFNPGGRVASGPQTGDGTASVTASISTSAARTLNDVGVNDDLAAAHTIDATGNLSTQPGINRNGTGTLAASCTVSSTSTVGRVGTGSLSVATSMFASADVVSAQSGTGTGTLAVQPTISATTGINRNGSGALSYESAVVGGATYKRAVASTLSVTATITCSASTTAKWNNKPRNSGTWTNIART